MEGKLNQLDAVAQRIEQCLDAQVAGSSPASYRRGGTPCLPPLLAVAKLKPLSLEELKALNDDPWAIWYPKPKWWHRFAFWKSWWWRRE